MTTSLLRGLEATAFRAGAEKYCALIDGHQSLARPDFLGQVHRALAVFYSAAADLPIVASISESGPEVEGITDSEWHRIHDSLVSLLGPQARYFEIFDPLALDQEPLEFDLADDLADVYREAREALETERQLQDTHPTDVLWSWRFGWEHHWGRHALSAMRALYASLTGHYARSADGDAAV